MSQDTTDAVIAELAFNDDGLIPAIAQQADTGEILMMAWMNADAVARTLETGRVTYWSRSRAAFWVKGETSGHVQALVEMRVDCDRESGHHVRLALRRTCGRVQIGSGLLSISRRTHSSRSRSGIIRA